MVGAAARRQRQYDGRQPGDPARAAQAILAVAAMDAPPLWLALGSDAVASIRTVDQARLAELERRRPLSESTDFAAGAVAASA